MSTCLIPGVMKARADVYKERATWIAAGCETDPSLAQVEAGSAQVIAAI